MRIALTLAALALCTVASAQLGGSRTYEFLNLPASAKLAALGGDVVSVQDGNLNAITTNPALLDSTMENKFAINYINYVAGINMGYVAHARNIGNLGTVAAGLQYVNYGQFTRADENGNVQGDFSAGEYALSFTYAYQYDSLFAFGGSFKTIYSALAGYTSLGLALDAGATYTSKNKLFTTGLSVRNAGAQVTAYVDGNREPLPLAVTLGVTQRLKKAPFRVSAVARNLQQWDLTYPEEDDDPDQESKAFTIDNVARHFGFGVEFLPSDNFFIALGYNHQRRSEMNVAARGGMTGISLGAGIKARKFSLAYGRSQYHIAGATNQFSMVLLLGQPGKRQAVKI